MVRSADVAARWLAAISARDKEALLAVSHAAIELHSPWGVSVGHELLSGWFDATPMRIAVKSLAERGTGVLVLHQIDFLDEGGRIDSTIDNAAMIEVRDGKVFSYRRVTDTELLSLTFTPME